MHLCKARNLAVGQS